MKFSTKVILGLSAIVVLSGIYYGDNYFTQRSEERQKEKSFAIYFETKDVLKYSVKNKNGTFTFVRETNEAPWKILEPSSLTADQDTVNNTLASIQQLSVQQELSNTENALAGDKTMLAQFGFDKPSSSVVVESKEKGKLELFLGVPVDFGGKSPKLVHSTSIYAMNPTKKSLLVVSNSFSSTIEDKTLSDFRSKRVADFKGNNVAQIEVSSRDESLLVTKNKDSWEIKKPTLWQADSNFISDYLARFQGLLAQKVYETSELTPELKEKFALNRPVASVTFKDAAGKALQTFNLSITKDGIYSIMRDGAVAKIALDLWPELVPKEKYFRNRLIMLNVPMEYVSKLNLSPSLTFVRKDNNWYRVSSQTQQPSVSETPNSDALTFFSNWEFMSADDMILKPTSSDLVRFGLTKPLKEFSFEFSEVSHLKPIKIIIGNRVPKNEKNVYLKRSDTPIVYIVEAGWLSLLAQLYSVGDPSNTSVKKQME